MTRRCTQRLMVACMVSQILVYGLAFQAAGQGVMMLHDDASRCTIFRALSAQVPPDCQGRFRSIVFQNATALAPGPHNAPAPAQPERIYAFATRIPFAFASQQLTPEAHQLLDTLATVLKDPLMAGKMVRIEGHTDSVGSDAYNMRLSSRRAVAVQRYLHARHGLATAQIPAVGRGKYALYDPDHPSDAVNRRVQFVNVSDSGDRR